MPNWSPIEQEFLASGTVRGGILMLSPHAALALVSRARETQQVVLGVDGFWITATTTQPSIENSVDLSASSREGSWDAAERFLSRYADSNMMFEVVVEEPKAG